MLLSHPVLHQSFKIPNRQSAPQQQSAGATHNRRLKVNQYPPRSYCQLVVCLGCCCCCCFCLCRCNFCTRSTPLASIPVLGHRSRHANSQPHQTNSFLPPSNTTPQTNTQTLTKLDHQHHSHTPTLSLVTMTLPPSVSLTAPHFHLTRPTNPHRSTN
ncbi:hypothetical protein BJ508DRAFT_116544 [Ascobolus immersus RN42]|uniref:Uncharacterized protein n=1 Tax=Ascobolus immersus RN42 TaxID=1160509 RepID=A0A3N4I4R0_ASCIM|nr:hypothetical protein BJ508DRAFT_116544 [Ascobolus immersus RN42]